MGLRGKEAVAKPSRSHCLTDVISGGPRDTSAARAMTTFFGSDHSLWYQAFSDSFLAKAMSPFALCLLAGLLLAAPAAGAQALPLDEAGRVAVAEVVPADSLRAGLLYNHARAWLRRRGYELAEADSAAGRLVAAHAFGMYDHGYVTKHLHGKVHYRLVVEVKDGRYRSQFTDFSFAYYQDDRNARPQPTGKTKPLEDTAAPGWQKLWEAHRRDTLLTVTTLAGELKTAMLAVPKPPALPFSRAANW